MCVTENMTTTPHTTPRPKLFSTSVLLDQSGRDAISSFLKTLDLNMLMALAEELDKSVKMYPRDLQDDQIMTEIEGDTDEIREENEHICSVNDYIRCRRVIW